MVDGGGVPVTGAVALTAIMGKTGLEVFGIGGLFVIGLVTSIAIGGNLFELAATMAAPARGGGMGPG